MHSAPIGNPSSYSCCAQSQFHITMPPEASAFLFREKPESSPLSPQELLKEVRFRGRTSKGDALESSGIATRHISRCGIFVVACRSRVP